MKIVNRYKFARFIVICLVVISVGGYIAYGVMNDKDEIEPEIVYDPVVISKPLEVEITVVDVIYVDVEENWVNPDDIRLLSKVLYSEINYAYHDGQWVKSTDEEMAYVGQVVMNRVKHNYFPDTLKGVVYDKTQFCSVRSDTWGITTERTDRIAKEVLQGKYEIDRDVLYFFNPDIATNREFVKAKMPLVVFESGGHVFTK